ncbi:MULTISPECIES: hypothetical protein [Campylobacter]|uniref:hypothetical protein n=1 Tax=Campylobacter TaxID=194 RepID=UPI0015DDA10F|nr:MULTISPECIES: hypothetical protein [Campylobacter]EHL1545620.1 hypothetical protein [Campylobacter jejuni]EHT1194857.1 hypothetical protein [Campylobacter jejuni]EHT1217419.1 hypothetical protein [Campylobacter jejuni]EHV2720305.1 hypothetical protein [Campylobacter jejuni]EHY0926123.1 hypothetical protein [Campylobacter jejuni]
MDKIQENTKIEKAILAEKQQIFLIQNKLSEIEKNIKEQYLTVEQIQNSITEKNQNLSNIEYKENQSIDSLENFFNTYSNWETYCQEIEKYLNLKK